MRKRTRISGGHAGAGMRKSGSHHDRQFIAMSFDQRDYWLSGPGFCDKISISRVPRMRFCNLDP